MVRFYLELFIDVVLDHFCDILVMDKDVYEWIWVEFRVFFHLPDFMIALKANSTCTEYIKLK